MVYFILIFAMVIILTTAFLYRVIKWFRYQCSLFNVKDLAYGAKGDGRTDDTDAIQKAINASYRNGGGTLFVPDGTYIIKSSSLFTPSVFSITGYGCIFRPIPSNEPLLFIIKKFDTYLNSSAQS